MNINKALRIIMLAIFVSSNLFSASVGFSSELNLPAPGSMVNLSSQFKPAIVKGIKIDPRNPLIFEFLIEPGQTSLDERPKKIQYQNLIKYFLASLTTSEKDMWVNLSPYEHNRIISSNLGNTQMGRDMLSQDYILKQLTASLVYPESNLGQQFWKTLNDRIKAETGMVSNVSIDTFNKVWILPKSATIFEKGNVAYVTESHLKVMMQEDYMALKSSEDRNIDIGKNENHKIASDVVRQIVIPAIEKEVNEGENFVQLRQIYNSMILASWFKERLKMHILNKIYSNKDKSQGVQIKDPKEIQAIFESYLQAYKKGVYNYIKEEPDPMSGQMLPRKYFSGGLGMEKLAWDQGLIGTTDVLPADISSAAMDSVKVALNPASPSRIPMRIRSIASMFLVGFMILTPATPLLADLTTQEQQEQIAKARNAQLTEDDQNALNAFAVLVDTEFKGGFDRADVKKFNDFFEQIPTKNRKGRLTSEAYDGLRKIYESNKNNGPFLPRSLSYITELRKIFESSGLLERNAVAELRQSPLGIEYDRVLIEAYKSLESFIKDEKHDPSYLDKIKALPKSLPGNPSKSDKKVPDRVADWLIEFSGDLFDLKEPAKILKRAIEVHRIIKPIIDKTGLLKNTNAPAPATPAPKNNEKPRTNAPGGEESKPLIEPRKVYVENNPPVQGGIDFDAKYLQMNMKGDGRNIPTPQGFDWLLTTPISGFEPQILEIRSGVGFELSFFNGLTPLKQNPAKP